MLDSVLETLALLYRDFNGWHPQPLVYYTVIFLSALASVILTRVISGAQMITMPICFVGLYALAMLANFLGRHLHIAGLTEIERTLMLTVLAQSIGAVVLLFAFKASEGVSR